MLEELAARSTRVGKIADESACRGRAARTLVASVRETTNVNTLLISRLGSCLPGEVVCLNHSSGDPVGSLYGARAFGTDI